MKNQLKRILTVLLSAILVAGTLAMFSACDPNRGKTVLTVWSMYPLTSNYESALKIDPNHREANVTKMVIDKFKELHPDVKVNLVDQGWGDKLNENVIRLAAANQFPDVLASEVYTQAWAERDFLAPIPFDEETRADLINSTIVGHRRGDDIYAAPVLTNMFDLIYNEDVLKAAGLPQRLNQDTGLMEVIPPATVRELIYCVGKVNDYYDIEVSANQRNSYGAYVIHNEQGVGGGFRALQYLRMAGGDFAKLSNVGDLITADKFDLNTDEAKNAFTLMRILQKYAPFGLAVENTSQPMYNALLNGQIGLTIEHPTFILDASAGLNLKVASVPVFSGEKDANGLYDMTPFVYTSTTRDTATKQPEGRVMVGNDLACIPKKAKQPELAMDFIKLLMSEEVQLEVMKWLGRFPTTKSNMAAVEQSSDPVIKNNVKLMRSSLDALKATYEGTDPRIINGGLPCWEKNHYDIWTDYRTFTGDLYNYGSGQKAIPAITLEVHNKIAGRLA